MPMKVQTIDITFGVGIGIGISIGLFVFSTANTDTDSDSDLNLGRRAAAGLLSTTCEQEGDFEGIAPGTSGG